MVSVEFSESITETLDILSHMENAYIDKIPKKFMDFLEKNKSLEYKVQFDHSKKMSELNLKEKTKDILATIYMNYWCTPQEKSDYEKVLNNNEIIYQEELREKYSVDKLFEKRSNKVNEMSSNNLPMEVQEKEGIFAKIIKFMKNIFSKNIND